MRRSRHSYYYDRVEKVGQFKYIKLKSGRMLSWTDTLTAIDYAHTALATAISRCFKLLPDKDVEWYEYDLEMLEWKIDHLESHIGAVRKEIEKLRGVKSKEERIALLRSTSGRTPEEAELFHRKADELEKKMKANEQ